MFPFQRYELIINAVKKSNFVTIDELLRLTKSSLTTLRRDINYLVEEGKIKKTRGGIQYVLSSGLNEHNFVYKNREKLFQKEKEAIGIAAQQFINDGDVIILTNGTTTLQVAKNIDENKQVTIITSGIDIVLALSDKPNVRVILLGGIVIYEECLITGPSISKMLQDLNPSKIISGAGGITAEKGISIYDFMGSSYFIELFEKAPEKIIVADHSKFDRDVLVQVCPLEKINTIITDKEVPAKYIEIFKRLNINYVLA